MRGETIYSPYTRLPCCFAQGYIRVKHPETGKWMDEGRYVLEQAHGSIPEGHYVKRKNKCKTHNWLANLELREQQKSFISPYSGERVCINSNRYAILIRKIDGKRIYEHQLIARKKFGNYDSSVWDVDHIDENKRNNHPDNLRLMLKGAHVRRHKTGNTYRQLFTDTHAHCHICKQMLPHSAFGKCKSRASGLQNACRECHNEKNRQFRASETPAQRESRLAKRRQYRAKRKDKQ